MPAALELREQRVALAGPRVHREQVVGAAAAALDEPGDAVDGDRGAAQVLDALAQHRLVAADDGLAAVALLLEVGQLGTQQRGVEVGEVGLVPELDEVPVLVGARVAVGGGLAHAVVAQPAEALGDGGMPGGDGAAVAARHVLGGVEGEDRRVAEIARAHAVALDLDAVGRVLDDEQALASPRWPAARACPPAGRTGARAGCPRCARLMAARTAAGSMRPVAGSTSTSFGLPPRCRMALAVQRRSWAW